MHSLTAVAIAVTMSAAGMANAQMLPNSIVRGMDADAMKAIAPVVQAVLADATPGAIRLWTSAGGHGHVRLISPDPKRPACRRVRMSSVVGGVEKRGYIFLYCPDPSGRWRIAG